MRNTTSPFYLNKEELSTFKRGNELTFFDKPSRILNAEKNIAWRAELTLVGFNSSGAHALHTMWYGFNFYSNYHILTMPLKSKQYENRYWWLK